MFNLIMPDFVTYKSTIWNGNSNTSFILVNDRFMVDAEISDWAAEFYCTMNSDSNMPWLHILYFDVTTYLPNYFVFLSNWTLWWAIYYNHIIT